MAAQTTVLAGDLPGVKLVSSTGGTCEVYTHGAHVASWKTSQGDDIIFLSSDVSGALVCLLCFRLCGVAFFFYRVFARLLGWTTTTTYYDDDDDDEGIPAERVSSSRR